MGKENLYFKPNPSGLRYSPQRAQTAGVSIQPDLSKYVPLDNGEYISKSDYDKLTPEQQTQLKTLGVSAFNAKQNADLQSQLANYYKLDNGDYVLKADYDKLPAQQQLDLKTLGVEGFNTKQNTDLQAQLANFVKLDNGDYVNKDDFAKLTAEQQANLKALGVAGYNAKVGASNFDMSQYAQLSTGEYVPISELNKLSSQDQQMLFKFGVAGFNEVIKTRAAQFEASNIKLSTGEYIPKEAFNSLSADNQQQLMSLGVKKFNEKQELAQKEFETKYYKLPTGEYISFEDWNKLQPTDQNYIINNGLSLYVDVKNREYQAQQTAWNKAIQWMSVDGYGNRSIDIVEAINHNMTADELKLLGITDAQIQSAYMNEPGFNTVTVNPPETPVSVTTVDPYHKLQMAGAINPDNTINPIAVTYGISAGEITIADLKAVGITDLEINQIYMATPGFNVTPVESFSIGYVPGGHEVIEELIPYTNSTFTQINAPQYLLDKGVTTNSIETVQSFYIQKGMEQPEIEKIIGQTLDYTYSLKALEPYKVLYENGVGYDIVQYLRDNPNGQATLSSVGYQPIDIAKAQETALLAPSIQTYVQNALKENGMTEQQYIDAKKYIESRGTFPSQDKEHWDIKRQAEAIIDKAKIEYKEKYGALAEVQSIAAPILALGYLPARAIAPDVTWGDIQPWEKVVGAAQLAAMAIPGLSAAGGALKLGGNIAFRSAMTIADAAITGIFIADTVKNAPDMSIGELVFASSMNALMVGGTLLSLKGAIQVKPPTKAQLVREATTVSNKVENYQVVQNLDRIKAIDDELAMAKKTGIKPTNFELLVTERVKLVQQLSNDVGKTKIQARTDSPEAIKITKELYEIESKLDEFKVINEYLDLDETAQLLNKGAVIEKEVLLIRKAELLKELDSLGGYYQQQVPITKADLEVKVVNAEKAVVDTLKRESPELVKPYEELVSARNKYVNSSIAIAEKQRSINVINDALLGDVPAAVSKELMDLRNVLLNELDDLIAKQASAERIMSNKWTEYGEKSRASIETRRVDVNKTNEYQEISQQITDKERIFNELMGTTSSSKTIKIEVPEIEAVLSTTGELKKGYIKIGEKYYRAEVGKIKPAFIGDPPIADGHTRLYRGENITKEGTEPLFFTEEGRARSGNWYTTNKSYAMDFAKKNKTPTIRYVDVPTAELHKYKSIHAEEYLIDVNKTTFNKGDVAFSIKKTDIRTPYTKLVEVGENEALSVYNKIKDGYILDNGKYYKLGIETTAIIPDKITSDKLAKEITDLRNKKTQLETKGDILPSQSQINSEYLKTIKELDTKRNLLNNLQAEELGSVRNTLLQDITKLQAKLTKLEKQLSGTIGGDVATPEMFKEYTSIEAPQRFAKQVQETIDNIYAPDGAVAKQLEQQISQLKTYLEGIKQKYVNPAEYADITRRIEDLEGQLKLLKYGASADIFTELNTTKAKLTELREELTRVRGELTGAPKPLVEQIKLKIKNLNNDISLTKTRALELENLLAKSLKSEIELYSVREELSGGATPTKIDINEPITKIPGGAVRPKTGMNLSDMLRTMTLSAAMSALYGGRQADVISTQKIDTGSKTEDMPLITTSPTTTPEVSPIIKTDIETTTIGDVDIQVIPDIEISPRTDTEIEVAPAEWTPPKGMPYSPTNPEIDEFVKPGEFEKGKPGEFVEPSVFNKPDIFPLQKPMEQVKAKAETVTKVDVDTATAKAVDFGKKPFKALTKKQRKEEERERKRKEFAGALSWKQGFGWVAIKEPYSQEDVAFFYGQYPPEGIIPVEGGKGAAYRSIQQYLVDNDMPDIHIQRGIMKIHITKPTKEPGASGAIQFETTQRGREKQDDLQIDLDDAFAESPKVTVPTMEADYRRPVMKPAKVKSNDFVII